MGASCSTPTSLKIYKLIFAGLLTLSLLSYGVVAWNEKDKIVSGYGDFISFYTGAQIVNEGRGRKLYDLSLQAKVQKPFNVEIRQGPLPFNHLPYELVLFLPLAKIPYPFAYAVWTLINGILLVGILKLLFPFIDAVHQMLLGMLLLAFYPTTVTLLHGQDSILSAFLLAAGFANLKKKRDGAAGILLALGLYKPQLVLPLGAFLFLKRRWGAVLGFGLMGCVLTMISLAIVGWSGVIDYLHLLSWMDRIHYAIVPANMANIRGLAEGLSGFSPASQTTNLVVLLICISLYGWSVLLWKGDWDPTQRCFDLAFSHMIVVSLLLSYHLNVHDLVLLVIPLVVMTNDVFLTTQAALVRPAFLTLLLMFYCPFAALWLLKKDLFAWAAVALIALALVIAKEIIERNRQEHLMAPSAVGG